MINKTEIRHRQGKLWAALLALALHACAMGPVVANDVLPDVSTGSATVKLSLVAQNLHSFSDGTRQICPTGIHPDGSGRLFVTTLGGVVRVISPEGSLLTTPYLNTTRNPETGEFDDRVFNKEHRHGLTAFAFHPDFHNPGKPGYGKLYTILTQYLGSGEPDFTSYYQDSSSPPTPLDQVLVEWTTDSPSAPTFSGTWREIFRVLQPKDDHNMDHMLFGPDGYLYIESGDGANVRDYQLPPNPGVDGVSQHGQDLRAIFGKIIRIDPLHPSGTPDSGDLVSANGNYRVPVSNPFADDGDPDTLAEIYSYGHRNTYGMSFDPVTCDLYTGEVGQLTVEEFNRIVPGGNYGWFLKEGGFIYEEGNQNTVLVDTNGQFAQTRGLIDPIFQYDHDDGRAAVGGGIYRGREIPSLYGKYIFGELQGRFGSGGGRLFHGSLDDGSFGDFRLSQDGESLPRFVYAVQANEDGEYYIAGGSGNYSSGVILRMEAPQGPASFNEWAAALLPEGAQGPADTPFGDNIPNLVRFAFAIPPGGSSCQPTPKPLGLSLRPGGDGTELAYRASAPGVSYLPQWSDDLSIWNDAQDGSMLNGEPVSVSQEGPEVRVSFPATEIFFVRVRLELESAQ